MSGLQVRVGWLRRAFWALDFRVGEVRHPLGQKGCSAYSRQSFVCVNVNARPLPSPAANGIPNTVVHQESTCASTTTCFIITTMQAAAHHLAVADSDFYPCCVPPRHPYTYFMASSCLPLRAPNAGSASAKLPKNSSQYRSELTNAKQNCLICRRPQPFFISK